MRARLTLRSCPRSVPGGKVFAGEQPVARSLMRAWLTLRSRLRWGPGGRTLTGGPGRVVRSRMRARAKVWGCLMRVVGRKALNGPLVGVGRPGARSRGLVLVSGG
ncbi:hypothetical protein GCM10027589_51330 [Actinocorallia lasiicapitis]